MMYILAKSISLIGSGLLGVWLLKKPQSWDLSVLGLMFLAIALKQTVWLADTVLAFGRPEWLRVSVVLLESLCILVTYIVLRFARHNSAPRRRKDDVQP